MNPASKSIVKIARTLNIRGRYLRRDFLIIVQGK
jgi:hypothetical protein